MKVSAPANQVTKLLHESLRKYAKFDSTEIKDSIIGVLEALDDDLEAADYIPSTGENSVEEAVAALEEAILDFEAQDDEEETEEDDEEEIDEDEEDEEPAKS